MEEEMVENKEWVLTAYAEEGLPTTQHLQLRTTRLPILSLEHIPEGHVSVQNLWLCVDPYMRTIMTGRNEGLYLPQFQLNQVVKTFGIGRVIKSKEKDYMEGDIVLNTECPIAEYSFMPTRLLRKLDATAGVDFVNYLSALGLAGFTAWVGIQVLGNPKPGENVFISAAAGGVGMYAGQLAKLKGCRVVGSTGTDDKVKFLKEELGFDDAFNYKKEADYNAALSKYFPDGIDIYLDNVGGKMLEAVLNHVNKRARIPLCGMISQYNQGLNQREKVGNLLNLVGKEVKMEGFLMSSYLNHFGDFTLEMEGYIKQGKISTKHEIYHGIESFLDSLASMFSGSNVGKIIIQLKEI